MKKSLLFLSVIVILLLSGTPTVFARGQGDKTNNGQNRFELKIQNAKPNKQSLSLPVPSGTPTPTPKSDQKFEVKGIISSLSGNTLVVSGQTVTVDPSKVSNFRQKGLLEVGQEVMVRGIIKDGVKLATDIKVKGDGHGRFKLDVKNGNSASTASESIRTKVKAMGANDQVTLFLEQVLSFLKSLV